MSTAGIRLRLTATQDKRHRCQLHPRDYSLTPRDYLWVALLWIATIALRYILRLACLLVLIGAAQETYAQVNTAQPIFTPGEILQYKVKWGFFRLGTIVMTQQRCDSLERGGCLITMDVQSAPGLPFINVHFVNRSRKSPGSLWVSEESIVTGEDSTELTVYRYDHDTGTLYCSGSTKAKPIFTTDTVQIGGYSYDALGLFMLARVLSPTKGTVVVPTLNECSVHETEINITGDVEEIEVAACDTPVRCRRIDGFARWVGTSFAGMKGPFAGWISDDAASIPLRAELKIFLGSIVLELESTNRTDWRPNRIASVRQPGR